MKEIVIDNVTVVKKYSHIRPTFYNDDELYVFDCEVEFPITELEKLSLKRDVTTAAQLEELDKKTAAIDENYKVQNEYKDIVSYFPTPHVVFMNTQDGKEKMDIWTGIKFRKNKDGEDVAYTYAISMVPKTKMKLLYSCEITSVNGKPIMEYLEENQIIL